MKILTTLLIAVATLGLATQFTSCQTASAAPKKDCCKSGAAEKSCCAMKAKASCCDKPGAAGEAHVH